MFHEKSATMFLVIPQFCTSILHVLNHLIAAKNPYAQKLKES